jgi:hypothetical protein
MIVIKDKKYYEVGDMLYRIKIIKDMITKKVSEIVLEEFIVKDITDYCVIIQNLEIEDEESIGSVHSKNVALFYVSEFKEQLKKGLEMTIDRDVYAKIETLNPNDEIKKYIFEVKKCIDEINNLLNK